MKLVNLVVVWILFVFFLFSLLSNVKAENNEASSLQNCVSVLDTVRYKILKGSLETTHGDLVLFVVEKAFKSDESYATLSEMGLTPTAKSIYNGIKSTNCAVINISINYSMLFSLLADYTKKVELKKGQVVVVAAGNIGQPSFDNRNFDLFKKEDLIIVAGLDVKKARTVYSSGSKECPELENNYKCVYQPGVIFIPVREAVFRDGGWSKSIVNIPIRGSSVAAPVEAARLLDEKFPPPPLKVLRNL